MLFAVLFARIREKGILDFIAHGSILQGFTVAWSGIIGFKCKCRLGWYLHFHSSSPYFQSLIPHGSLSMYHRILPSERVRLNKPMNLLDYA